MKTKKGHPDERTNVVKPPSSSETKYLHASSSYGKCYIFQTSEKCAAMDSDIVSSSSEVDACSGRRSLVLVLADGDLVFFFFVFLLFMSDRSDDGGIFLLRSDKRIRNLGGS